MKISELIENLSHTLKTLGDAEVCLEDNEKQILAIDALVECYNIELPGFGKKNILLMRPKSPS